MVPQWETVDGWQKADWLSIRIRAEGRAKSIEGVILNLLIRGCDVMVVYEMLEGGLVLYARLANYWVSHDAHAFIKSTLDLSARSDKISS